MTESKTTKISEYMNKIYNDMYVSEKPHYIILLEDVDVDEMTLKAGHYKNGEWLHE